MAYRYIFLFTLLVPCAAYSQAALDIRLEAPDGTFVTIDRDEYGVPHITAETEAAVFFGQGFAVAQDRLFQMETFWRTATGRLAELQGEAALAQDQAIRTVYYTSAERQEIFEALPSELQTMLSSFVEGVNAYIDLAESNAAAYLPFEYTQFPLNAIGIERWDIDKVVAVAQFFIRRFGGAGGQELTRLAELEANGLEWFNDNRPINDAEAPVTLESSPRPAGTLGTYKGPAIHPDVAARVAQERAALDASLDAFGVPRKFGSVAAVLSGEASATGNVMLLGAPQMGQPQPTSKAVTYESELLVGDADDPVLHVAGMTVPGIPGVIIGRTEGRAWTFTTGGSDNTDTYVVTLGTRVGSYLYDGESVDFEVITETISVLGGAPVEFTHRRTVHGPVYADQTGTLLVFAYRYAFWKSELEMATALYGVWKADDIAGFQAAASGIPVSFNFFYADQEQNIAFWHVGDYPVRPAGTDPRLPLLGDGTQEWEGFLDFEQQPQAINPPQGYFVNWNNKPVAWWDHGDNVPWTDTTPGRLRVYDGVTYLDAHIEQHLPVSFEEFQQLMCVMRSNPAYPEYPGTYQQVVEFSFDESYAENVIPPGQSGFINSTGVPSPNFADQWAFYQSSIACEEVTMKPFTFSRVAPVANESGGALGERLAFNAVYPNPAVGNSVTVQFEVPQNTQARLELVDVLGRTVAVVEEERGEGVREAMLDTRDLASGLYVLRLTAEGQTVSRKVTVVR